MFEFIAEYPYLIAVFIFLTRVADISLKTIRTIVVFRGYKSIAILIGIFEIGIWLVAAAHVFNNLDQLYLLVEYFIAFATGIYVGIWLENRILIRKELLSVTRLLLAIS